MIRARCKAVVIVKSFTGPSIPSSLSKTQYSVCQKPNPIPVFFTLLFSFSLVANRIADGIVGKIRVTADYFFNILIIFA